MFRRRRGTEVPGYERKAAALTRASNELVKDSAPEARAILEYDNVRAVTLLLDEQCLPGNGTAPNLR